MPDVGRIFLVASCATVAGILLGIPQRNRPGGIRTHVMVTLGATLFCAIAHRISAEYGKTDPLRVLQGIATGVGFIGAATVLKGRTTVVGVNTAASIWVAAAVGCEISFGNPMVSVAVAAFISAVNAGLLHVERRLSERDGRRKLRFDRAARANGPRAPPPA